MEGQAPSIVVFSRGRPHRLRRLFAYHARYPGQVIVMDGSPQRLEVAALPPNAEYHHLPDAPIYRRIAEGMARATAPTCCLAADDDYVVHEGLLECSRVILADPSVSTACGTIVYFVPDDPQGVRAAADGAVERHLDLPDVDAPSERFASFLRLEPQVFYGCMRTETAQRVAAILGDLSDDEALVGEQLRNALPSLFGHCRMVHRLQVCRRREITDYGWYLGTFRALEDIAEWPRFAEMSSRVRALARQAGADDHGADAVIEAWRSFAAATRRGRRSWKARRFSWQDRSRRAERNVRASVAVAIKPSAWFDALSRRVVRDVAVRATLRSSAYPWSDPAARADYARIMAFDAQQAAPAEAT